MELIGLDIGFSATRPTTGVARLSGSTLICRRATSAWESRAKVLGDHVAQVTAIDGPLLRRLDSPKRACESIFSRGAFSHRCKPAFSHVHGTGLRFRSAGRETAARLAKLTSGHDLAATFPRVRPDSNLVEAFPNAFLGVMLSDDAFRAMPALRRGKKFDWLYDQCRDILAFRRLLDVIGHENLPHVRDTMEANSDHEERAALVCILTAAGVASGRYVAVGNEQGGYFFLPSWECWEQWARQEIDAQRERVRSVDIWIDGKRFGPTDSLPTHE